MSRNTLKKWMEVATPDQVAKLAKRAKTTVGSLRQMAGGYRTEGKVSTTAVMARRIEIAAKTIPEVKVSLTRGDLCQACGVCEHFKSCQSSDKK
jgi:hypothetical protein